MFPQVFYGVSHVFLSFYEVPHVSLSFLQSATSFFKFSIECHMFP